MSEKNQGLFERLNAPFPYDEYAVNHGGFVSVSPQATSDRLNMIFGPEGWKLEVVKEEVDMERFCVSVLGKISIRSETGEWIEKSQFGDATMVVPRGKIEPTAQAILNAKKIAVSDAMKKCASLLGVASDVYRGKLTAIKSHMQDYRNLIDRYQLNARSKQFREGIVLLPDDYKAYFEANKWDGIFVSDLTRKSDGRGQNNSDAPKTKKEPELSEDTLKSKFEQGKGSAKGFAEWVEKMKGKDLTFPQMDYILQKALNKKATTQTNPEETKQPKADSGQKENVGSQKSPSAAGSKPKDESSRSAASSTMTNSEAEPLQAILTDLEIAGDEKPYLVLKFNMKGIPTEVFACGELMDEVERLSLKKGSKCSIWTREAKGRNLLRKIRLAS